MKTGRVSREQGRFYRRLCESREKGDYADLVTFDPEEVEDWLGGATSFVAEIAELAT